MELIYGHEHNNLKNNNFSIVTERCEAHTDLEHPDAKLMSSNPVRGLHVCQRFFMLCNAMD